MAIEFVKEKCWLHDPDQLKVKRYLSDTRAYFRDGIWIRDYFDRFFPNIGIDPSKGLYYDLNTVNPVCVCDAGGNIKDVRIPEEELESFSNAVAKYEAHLLSSRLSFNEESATDEFTLPRPDLHPDLYWVVETEEGPRLLVLWGLESEKEGGNLPVAEIKDLLFESFKDKHAPKKRPVRKAVETEEKPSKSEAPVEEQKTVVQDAVETVPPPAEPAPETRSEKPVAVARYDFKPWAKGAFVLGLAVVLLVGFSKFYLGRPVVISEAVAAEQKAMIPVDGAEFFARMPDRRYVLDNGPKRLYIPQWVKPGLNEVVVGHQGTVESTYFHYDNSRGDMRSAPEAYLPILKKVYTIGENVVCDLSPILKIPGVVDVSISWGEENAHFEKVSLEQAQRSHSYETTGEYIVTLLTKDDSGSWDFDSQKLTVVESLEALQPATFDPVADIQVIGLKEANNAVEVFCDFSGSYDPDGSVELLKVDWGDHSEPVELRNGIFFASHRYSSTAVKTLIQVTAQDDAGNNCLKPASVEIDFKSAGFPAFLEKFGRFDDNARTVRLGQDNTSVRIKQIRFNNPYRNKTRVLFELLPPVNDPYAVYDSIEWKLESDDQGSVSLADSMSLDLKLVDSTYRLHVVCRSPDGSTWETTESFTLNSRKKWHWITTMTDILARIYPF
jgi:hypothetical protein